MLRIFPQTTFTITCLLIALTSLSLFGCGVLPPALLAIETGYITVDKYTTLTDDAIVKACDAWNLTRLQTNTRLAFSPVSTVHYAKVSWFVEAGDTFCANPPSGGNPIDMAIWLAKITGMLISESSQSSAKIIWK
jgi:hypothetical protein